MANIELGNLYDFNKVAMNQFKPMDTISFNRAVLKIAQEMREAAEESDRHYWMLLCHERRDYTLFNIIEATIANVIVNELSPTLKNRGEIVDIEKQEDGTYEIWIRDNEKENFAYYLFPYDNGVIEVKN